jgi:hypothetical protein
MVATSRLPAHRLSAAFLSICSMACSSSVADPGYQLVAMAVGPVQVDSFHTVLRDSGIVVISTQLADTAARMEENQRVVATITTSAGDSEAIFVGRDICGQGGAFYLCRGLLVSMAQGGNIADLFDQFDDIPARLTLVSVSGRVGGLRVLGGISINYAASIVRDLPLVAGVTTDAVGSAGGTSASFDRLLSGAIALDFKAAHRGDGRIQASRGDTLSFRYENPDSSVVTMSVAIP